LSSGGGGEAQRGTREQHGPAMQTTEPARAVKMWRGVRKVAVRQPTKEMREHRRETNGSKPCTVRKPVMEREGGGGGERTAPNALDFRSSAASRIGRKKIGSDTQRKRNGARWCAGAVYRGARCRHHCVYQVAEGSAAPAGLVR